MHSNCPTPLAAHLEVAAEASLRLWESPYTLLRQVSCVYDRGVLFLHGRLPSYFHKQLAQETVGKLDGVNQVVNEIQVMSLP